MLNSADQQSLIGWLVVALGPVLAIAAFLMARRRRTDRWAIGAAAAVGLIWFVLTAEWLPPAWKSFWASHSISAGLITSLLIVVAGWLFVSEELAHKRYAALLTTWRQWVQYQCDFVEEMIEQERPRPDVPLLYQRMMAADMSARLLIQQQWVAALFVITSIRSDDESEDFIVMLGKLRDAGTFATRSFAQLEATLNWMQGDHLDEESIKAIWDKPLGSLVSLLSSLQALRTALGEAQWRAYERAGKEPTHPFVDNVKEMPRESRPWSRASDKGS